MMGAKAPFTLLKEGRVMKIRKGSGRISILLIICLLAIISTMGAGMSVYAQNGTVYTQQGHNPEAGKKKAIKRIGIGTAIGMGGGGLIGGRKGALIGGGLGAGGGTLFHIHKKRQYEKRDYRY